MRSLARALLLTVFCGAAGAAHAVCPTADNAALGFTLRDVTGKQVLRARRSADGETTTTQARGSAARVTYRGGLFPASSDDPEGGQSYEYRTDLSAFSLKVGETLSYEAILRIQGRPDRLLRGEISVIGTDRVAIGACSYPVFIIKRVLRIEGVSAPVAALVLFSADLGLGLRARILQPSGEIEDVRYGEIESDTL
jgi:hypothetical protein